MDFPKGTLPGAFLAMLNSADRRARPGVQQRPPAQGVSAASGGMSNLKSGGSGGAGGAAGGGGGILGAAFADLGPVVVSGISIAGTEDAALSEDGQEAVQELLVRGYSLTCSSRCCTGPLALRGAKENCQYSPGQHE